MEPIDYQDRTVYYKKGDSFIPLTRQQLYDSLHWYFPTDGIWLVQSTPNVSGRSLILKLGEVNSIEPYASFLALQDEVASFLNSYFTTTKTYCCSDLSQAILKFIASQVNIKIAEEEKR